MMKKISVVGSGPNGLTAAIFLARKGYKVTVYEALDRAGGGAKSYYNEKFGTIHDSCAAIHPMALISPAFKILGLTGSVSFVSAPLNYAHAHANSKLKYLSKIDSFAGVAAHAMLPPEHPIAIGVGATLNMAAKVVGWKIPVGGTQKITDFLVSECSKLNIKIILDTEINKENYKILLKDFDAVLWDTDPAIPNSIIDEFENSIKKRDYGLGAAKVDFITTSPIPWADSRLKIASTVHIGGSWKDISRSQRYALSGNIPSNPFTLVSQPSLFDASRAPAGLHTVWAYAHVPFDSDVDSAKIISNLIEKYAPGFKKTIVHSQSISPRNYSNYNKNYKGGDIFFGSLRSLQMLKQGGGINPWKLKYPGWYICSAGAPPGPGVHGMCGMFAALIADINLKKG